MLRLAAATAAAAVRMASRPAARPASAAIRAWRGVHVLAMPAPAARNARLLAWPATASRALAKDAKSKDGKGLTGQSRKIAAYLRSGKGTVPKLEDAAGFPVDIAKHDAHMKATADSFKATLSKYRIGPANPGSTTRIERNCTP